MKIHVKHPLKTDVDSAFKLCTEQKSQETVYSKLNCENPSIKREGRAPNVKLRISRVVPATNEVSHSEDWGRDGDGYSSEIRIEIKGVPVKIAGTKSLQPSKTGCTVEWNFDVTSSVPLVGSVMASFAGAQVEQNLEDEYKILKSLA